MGIGIEAIVNRQIQRWNLEMQRLKEEKAGTVPPRPVITVSRALGSGGGEVGRCVAERLNCQVVDRRIIEQIAERSEVRRDLVETLDEHARSQIEAWFEGLLRRRLFDESDYLRHLVEVLHSFAELGSVVIVGRGANFIAQRRPHLDVRVVASQEKRVERLVEKRKITPDEALAEIRKSDSERSKFVSRLFGRDWEDPLAYDLVINTDRICTPCVAAIIETAWFQRISSA
ncbi:MAG: cytidylate kinase-like family protein [bacterium]